ncbi:hypothetical protein OTK49_26770 [Vibrio coralliirubri]|uniref:hypothetical protein n=1 Tax=Vibrio coralliirubri TaxID=1516159 RepID=UPI002283B9F9|nr:hypothetical protein [Vibrio coralliirubri]MCY9866145.1 hypothetical protein [Vibrio coralliirubri]
MDKIKDLMTQAAKGAGIPDKIENPTGGSFILKLLISGRLLIPLALMITNTNHYRAFGKQLIHVEGGLLPDADVPFGCRIDGDIDLELTEYPIGYILIALTSTFHQMKPFILNGQIEEITILWKAEVEAASQGKSTLHPKDYATLPPLQQIRL